MPTKIVDISDPDRRVFIGYCPNANGVDSVLNVVDADSFWDSWREWLDRRWAAIVVQLEAEKFPA